MSYRVNMCKNPLYVINKNQMRAHYERYFKRVILRAMQLGEFCFLAMLPQEPATG